MSCLNCLKILEGDVVDYETFCEECAGMLIMLRKG